MNNSTAPLRVSETSYLLKAQILFNTDDQPLLIPELTRSQNEKIFPFYRSLIRGGVDRLSAVQSTNKLIAMYQIVNTTGVSVDVARKIMFGPSISEQHPDNEETFSGVQFFAVMPRAFEFLTLIQKERRAGYRHTIPKTWHSWTWERTGLSRVEVISSDKLLEWIDRVKVFQGTPQVIACESADPSLKDNVPKESSPLCKIEACNEKVLIRLGCAPEDLKGIQNVLVSAPLKSKAEVLEMLILPYKKVLT